MKRKSKNSTYQGKAIKPSMKKHLKALGLSSEQVYFNWCARRNFDTSLKKSKQDIEQEFAAFENERHAMKEHMRVHHNPNRFLEEACLGDVDAKMIGRPLWKQIALTIAMSNSNDNFRKELASFLVDLNKRTKFVFETIELGSWSYRYIDALINILDYKHYWLRDIDEWVPDTHNMHSQFQSLIAHLLDEYEVPRFMHLAWFRTDEPSKDYRNWYLHLASGKNIRTANNLPLELTKKMAHYFMLSPDHYSVEEAIKWGHIHAMGGDETLADAVVSSRIGKSFDEHKFWTSVFRFFIDNPMLDRSHVGPIIDYIYAQKFEVRECVTAPGVVEYIKPQQPNLSMRGRTPEALLKQVDRWHGNLAKSKDAQNYFFKKSGIAEFRQKTGEDKQHIWRIRELLSGAELIKEGREMQHCVASYARRCAAGSCSIWAMEYVSSKGIEKHQTIEVTRLKQIVQSRGKRNRYPTKSELNIIKKWAQTVGLSISPYVISRG